MHIGKKHVTPSETAWRALKMPILGRLVVGPRWYFDRGYEAHAAELGVAAHELAEIDRLIGADPSTRHDVLRRLLNERGKG